MTYYQEHEPNKFATVLYLPVHLNGHSISYLCQLESTQFDHNYHVLLTRSLISYCLEASDSGNVANLTSTSTPIVFCYLFAAYIKDENNREKIICKKQEAERGALNNTKQ